MRVRMAAGFLGLVFTACAQQPDLIITWIGQAGFVIRTDGGATVVADPPAPSVGYTLPNVTADAVTVTHNHTDHNNAAGVRGNFTLVDGRPVTARQEVAAAGTRFILIPGFHDNQNGTVRGPNTIVRWDQAGLRIAHFGDIGQEQLTDAQLADLKDLDLIFIPAGGFFTVTPERAATYVAQLRPKVAILMHYRTALGGPAQLAPLPDAAAPFSPVIYKPASVRINRATLPENTQVWVMQPASDIVAVNSAGFTPGVPVAPGSLASMLGNFAGSPRMQAQGYPLPRTLGGTEVTIDGKPVPLYYVSPEQINFQVPAAQTPGQALGEVRVNGQSLGRVPVTVTAWAPGVFGVANQDWTLNTATTPARRGQTLQIFATGQGAVSPAVDDGAATGQPFSLSRAMPNVFLGDRQLVVEFSGLAPGMAGVWQINVRIPADARAGKDIPLQIVMGMLSNTVPVTVVE